ncbi:uncharacterized protein LOC107771503 [Nicotiana tabacum]|uniref:Uncharacterized protein LOC107771503 n=1 Tax=Nicotiana tabacum TaxID=4097 RepID=A0A1S3Y2B2_TOBAC|nr:PREDICTED: uncharacterized protein LOC107771503 [Nicotiana tabacum]
MGERNAQADKELLGPKEAIGIINQREKEQILAESSINRGEPIEVRYKESHNGSAYQGNGNFFTRFSKLDFSQFSGIDLRTWLYKVDQYFSMDDVMFEQRVKVASIHMDGDVIAWHRSYVKSRTSTIDLSWTEYVLALNKRFGDNFEDLMEALKTISQTDGVKEYQAEFDTLLTAVNLTTKNAISYFPGGLKSELNKAVKTQAPRTLMQAYKIVRL